MNRVRIAFAATVVGLTLVGADAAIAGQAAPQGSSPQDLQPILSGKKFTPPIKGQAEVEFTKPVTKREKDMVVTTIQVKNISNAPIPRLTVDESWYDKGGGMIPGGKGVVSGLLQPGEIATIKIETPFNAKMSSNNWNFSHANGPVKPHLVKSFDTAAADAKQPAATKTTAKKK